MEPGAPRRHPGVAQQTTRTGAVRGAHLEQGPEHQPRARRNPRVHVQHAGGPVPHGGRGVRGAAFHQHRHLPREHLKQGYAQGPHVSGGGEGPPPPAPVPRHARQQLGRHEVQGARVAHGALLVAEAKVTEEEGRPRAQVRLLRHQDVVWLHVHVHQARRVHVGQPERHAPGQALHVARLSVPGRQFKRRLALQVHEHVPDIPLHPETPRPYDAGVHAQALHHVHLPLEVGPRVLVEYL